MTTTMPRSGRFRTAALLTGGVLALCWLLEVLDTVLHHALDGLGLMSWDFADLPSLVTAPFIHFGFTHLIANSTLFVPLGFLIALGGALRWLKVTGVTAVTSGLFAFFINPPHVLTAGLSGVLFGYLTYLIARGYFTRVWWQVLLGVVLLVSYGGVLWGVLPTDPHVSWQGHLGGAVGGLLLAWWSGRRRSATARG